MGLGPRRGLKEEDAQRQEETIYPADVDTMRPVEVGVLVFVSTSRAQGTFSVSTFYSTMNSLDWHLLYVQLMTL